MSVIQNIRDKYARISVIAIALALLGFIAMDAFTGRSNLFGASGPSNTVGKVNGKRIGADEFKAIVDQQEQNLQAQGYPGGEQTREQALSQAWEQEVSKILLQGEVDKIGIRVTEKELNNSVLFGKTPSEILKRLFADQQTGQYDPVSAAQQIKNLKKNGTPEQKTYISEVIDQEELVRKYEKYSSLLANSYNAPRWMLEKQNADNSQLSRISFVRKPYAEIPDSSIKITDQEIADYVSKHKKEFKQEENRSISYVSFSAAPSKDDSANIYQKLLARKAEMDTTKNIEKFLAADGSDQNYYNSYVNGKTIQIGAKDSIFKQPVGGVFGPYLDGGSYSLAKLMGVRQIPDSAKVRHILISTVQKDRTGQFVPVRDSADAKKLIDSVRLLIASGKNFDSVCAQFSEDPGSKDKGGVYEKGSGQMVWPFNDFIFTNPVGSKGVVKTEFGYHYIEILSQKGSATGYKIAYVSKQIEASRETDQAASNAASQFAADSRDEKSFNANYEKNLKSKGIIKAIATDITPNAFSITGLGQSRSFVRKIYDAKLGEVLQPESVGSDYVVAVVTEVNEEGTKSAAKARAFVEPILRNHKKAEQIKKQIGNISTLEAASTVLGKPIEPADSIRMDGSSSPTLSRENKVIGASFNPNNRGKVVTEAIEGSDAVFVVRVDNVTATAVSNANVEEQRKMMYERAKQQALSPYNSPLQPLKDAATIKDNRSSHY